MKGNQQPIPVSFFSSLSINFFQISAHLQFLYRVRHLLSFSFIRIPVTLRGKTKPRKEDTQIEHLFLGNDPLWSSGLQKMMVKSHSNERVWNVRGGLILLILVLHFSRLDCMQCFPFNSFCWLHFVFFRLSMKSHSFVSHSSLRLCCSC